MNILTQTLLLAQSNVVNQSLEVMWKGMLAVIIAIVAIIICIYIMQFIITKVEKVKKERAEAKLKAEQDAQNQTPQQ